MLRCVLRGRWGTGLAHPELAVHLLTVLVVHLWNLHLLYVCHEQRSNNLSLTIYSLRTCSSPTSLPSFLYIRKWCKQWWVLTISVLYQLIMSEPVGFHWGAITSAGSYRGSVQTTEWFKCRPARLNLPQLTSLPLNWPINPSLFVRQRNAMLEDYRDLACMMF